MKLLLSLCTDRLLPGAQASAPACTRVIYVSDGDTVVRSAGQAAGLATNSAWHGCGAVALTAGSTGAMLLRWELSAEANPTALESGAALTSVALSQVIELPDTGEWLIRCDRVEFPPGGVAYLHVHRGPGIRCLLSGTIRVEVNGTSHDVAPGGAWFEAGPDPVLALASQTGPTSFARVMILPRELLGKSSIRYVNPDDESKPKLQTYRVFIDEPLKA